MQSALDLDPSASNLPATLEPERTVMPVCSARIKEKSEVSALDPTRYGDWEKNGRCIDF